jgi:hypothetical protein
MDLFIIRLSLASDIKGSGLESFWLTFTGRLVSLIIDSFRVFCGDLLNGESNDFNPHCSLKP